MSKNCCKNCKDGKPCCGDKALTRKQSSAMGIRDLMGQLLSSAPSAPAPRRLHGPIRPPTPNVPPAPGTPLNRAPNGPGAPAPTYLHPMHFPRLPPSTTVPTPLIPAPLPPPIVVTAPPPGAIPLTPIPPFFAVPTPPFAPPAPPIFPSVEPRHPVAPKAGTCPPGYVRVCRPSARAQTAMRGAVGAVPRVRVPIGEWAKRFKSGLLKPCPAGMDATCVPIGFLAPGQCDPNAPDDADHYCGLCWDATQTYVNGNGTQASEAGCWVNDAGQPVAYAYDPNQDCLVDMLDDGSFGPCIISCQNGVATWNDDGSQVNTGQGGIQQQPQAQQGDCPPLQLDGNNCDGQGNCAGGPLQWDDQQGCYVDDSGACIINCVNGVLVWADDGSGVAPLAEPGAQFCPEIKPPWPDGLILSVSPDEQMALWNGKGGPNGNLSWSERPYIAFIYDPAFSGGQPGQIGNCWAWCIGDPLKRLKGGGKNDGMQRIPGKGAGAQPVRPYSESWPDDNGNAMSVFSYFTGGKAYGEPEMVDGGGPHSRRSDIQEPHFDQSGQQDFTFTVYGLVGSKWENVQGQISHPPSVGICFDWTGCGPSKAELHAVDQQCTTPTIQGWGGMAGAGMRPSPGSVPFFGGWMTFGRDGDGLKCDWTRGNLKATSRMPKERLASIMGACAMGAADVVPGGAAFVPSSSRPGSHLCSTPAQQAIMQWFADDVGAQVLGFADHGLNEILRRVVGKDAAQAEGDDDLSRAENLVARAKRGEQKAVATVAGALWCAGAFPGNKDAFRAKLLLQRALRGEEVRGEARRLRNFPLRDSTMGGGGSSWADACEARANSK